MKTFSECIPCFFKQAIEAAKIVGANVKTQKDIIDEVAKAIPTFSLNSTPPEMGRIVYNIIKKVCNNPDPYKDVKQKSMELSMKLCDRVKKTIDDAPDRLLCALEFAIAGNIIDYGANSSIDIEHELEKIVKQEDKKIKSESDQFFNYAGFKKSLNKSKTILYLGDNAGEIVFDKIFIEEILKIDKNKEIIYAVREKPIINDALIEDAKTCGIDTVARIISSGSDAPGTILSHCSSDFLKLYKSADMIISKGQGNFEALSEQKEPIFFLFIAKCYVVAKDVGCNYLDVLLISNEDHS